MPILLVDDEVVGLAVRRQLLETLGYTVSTATNGADGIALFTERDFSLVILDLRMPDLCGGEVLRELRRLKPDVPVLLLTGSMDQSCVAEANPDGFMTKGEGAAKLLDLISTLRKP